MEKIKEGLKKAIESKNFNLIIYIFGGAVAALLIFQAGVFVGFHKASFSYQWGNNYKNFFDSKGRERGMMDYENIFGTNDIENRGTSTKDFWGMMSGGGFMGAHGVTGKIIDIQLPNIVVTGENNTEKAILLNNDTIIRKQRSDLRPEELKLGDNLIIVGTPDENAEIVARMIRVVPSVSEINSATSSIKKQ